MGRGEFATVAGLETSEIQCLSEFGQLGQSGLGYRLQDDLPELRIPTDGKCLPRLDGLFDRCLKSWIDWDEALSLEP